MHVKSDGSKKMRKKMIKPSKNEYFYKRSRWST